MMRCGLLGERLAHSYSPAIHHMLGDYDYRLYEVAPERLGDFLARGEFDALNVTIPYKKAVLPYCATLSDTARALGSVNVLLRRADGSLHGDNADAFGFAYQLRAGGMEARSRRALVLGSGGASATVCAVLRKAGAEVTVISRSGTDNYENLSRHADAQLIVNATPVGMYPDNGASAVDLTRFPRLEGVLDLVYNPARTALLMQAEALGIPHIGGLSMLVAQAKRSAELFTGAALADDVIARAERRIAAQMRSIVLIGMPGCGKSTVAALLGSALGRPVYDSDDVLESRTGMRCAEVIGTRGEACFRTMESAVLAELGRHSGAVIATGGGSVLREENYAALHQNAVILWLRRDLSKLPREGRPLSAGDLASLFEVRRPRYERFADRSIDNNGTLAETVEQILAVLRAEEA